MVIQTGREIVKDLDEWTSPWKFITNIVKQLSDLCRVKKSSTLSIIYSQITAVKKQL
jgi:hypothetical protein